MKSLVSFVILSVLSFNSITVFGQDPIPEFYGVYALENGKLTSLKEEFVLNDFGPAVRFVFFAKGLGQPDDKIFFLPPPEKQASSNTGQFKGWDDFLKQSDTFHAAADRFFQYGVPANAVAVPVLIGPYGGNTDMVRIVPPKELVPGFYQLIKGVRFWIRKSEVEKFYNLAGGSTGGVKQSTSAPQTSNTPKYPISSGRNLMTRFALRNDTYGTIQVFLDESDSSFDIKAQSAYIGQLEVGSTHHIRAVVGRQTFQLEFTVPSIMRSMRVTNRGIGP